VEKRQEGGMRRLVSNNLFLDCRFRSSGFVDCCHGYSSYFGKFKDLD
jgi:hypothetical protein